MLAKRIARGERKSRPLVLVALALAFTGILGLGVWGLTGDERGVPAPASPSASATPLEGVTKPPLTTDQLQFQADRLLDVFVNNPTSVNAAFAALMQAHGIPSGCTFGGAGGAARGAKLRSDIAAAVEHAETTVPEGFGRPLIVVARTKQGGATAWVLLAQVCQGG
jgi:hypothetical protein